MIASRRKLVRERVCLRLASTYCVCKYCIHLYVRRESPHSSRTRIHVHARCAAAAADAAASRPTKLKEKKKKKKTHPMGHQASIVTRCSQAHSTIKVVSHNNPLARSTLSLASGTQQPLVRVGAKHWCVVAGFSWYSATVVQGTPAARRKSQTLAAAWGRSPFCQFGNYELCPEL